MEHSWINQLPERLVDGTQEDFLGCLFNTWHPPTIEVGRQVGILMSWIILDLPEIQSVVEDLRRGLALKDSIADQHWEEAQQCATSRAGAA